MFFVGMLFVGVTSWYTDACSDRWLLAKSEAPSSLLFSLRFKGDGVIMFY